MKDPVRLINRSGLASSLLRAGSEERPSSAQVRRAVTVLGTAAAACALTGEAAGGAASALVAGTAAGASVVKATGASVSLVLAAKWAAIGSVGAVLVLGATELGSRALPAAPAPPVAALVPAESNGPSSALRAVTPFETTNQADNVEAIDLAPKRDEKPRGSARAGEGTVRGASPQRARTIPPSSDVESLSAVRESLPNTGPTAVPSSPTSIARDEVAPSNRATSSAAEAAAQAPKNETPSAATLRLTKEVRLVDDAWSAVKQSDFARALLLLSEYERQFPELGLHPEVLFVRMEAEDRQGRAAAARLEAARIAALYPKSAQAERARALLNRH